MGGRSQERAEQRAWAGSTLGGFEVRQEHQTGTEWARVGRRGSLGGEPRPDQAAWCQPRSEHQGVPQTHPEAIGGHASRAAWYQLCFTGIPLTPGGQEWRRDGQSGRLCS